MSIEICDQKFNNSYDNADNLLDDLFKAAKLRENLIFRGISRDAEKYPNIMRVWSDKKYCNLYHQEIPILKAFRKYASSLIGSNYGILDFICCAQHYGLPTRLVDWTYDPFVALFFSLSAKPDNAKNFGYRLLMCNKSRQLVLEDIPYSLTVADYNIQSADIRVRGFELFTELISKEEFIEDYCEKEKLNVNGSLVILETNDSNLRINAQRGLFSIPKRLNKDFIEAEYKLAGVRTIQIESKIRDNVLKALKKLGYEKRKLFFDLQSICDSIKDDIIGSDKWNPYNDYDEGLFEDSDWRSHIVPAKK